MKKKIFITFKGLSIAKYFLRPGSTPLTCFSAIHFDVRPFQKLSRFKISRILGVCFVK